MCWCTDVLDEHKMTLQETETKISVKKKFKNSIDIA